ncbi:hypothetical protein [Phormidium tenue]|uniref:FHA domain containing protein n=1 Tax=Phormidium tenue FACHB-1050 TaxID=2692857 RepID=A0ABR8CB00_9CYAN|nr:hypothetical protein [Phormidium tenue]MBD2317719.1 hypothetical protein [Phormidium tenue FACHB-1050]
MSAIANSNQPEDKPKTSRVSSYWRNIPWKKLSSLLMAIALCFYLTACGGDNKPVSKAPTATVVSNINITEVSPPTEIQRLGRLLERYTPQVSIVSPKPDEVLNDTQVSVKFDVKNLPIFKNADFGLGPHIHVTLDNQEYKAVYDLTQSATFDHLSAGTHTIRAFASRPWHESFKNQGAYAQTTFHVLTKTGENTPEPKTPLLTYSRPVGTYGAEPIMLDFYLQNAPLHLLGKDEEAIDDWQVRATIDGKSFTFDRWEPIYLKGFKTGQNWVKLELLEPDGDAIANVFNSTAHLINYQPNGTDTLARLVSGEKIANIEAIVNPDYVPPAPEVTPAPVESASPEPAAITPTEKPAETPKAVVPSPAPAIKEETKPSVVPVIPVVPVPVVPVPVVPIKTTPEAIAPIAPKPAPITEPIKSKSTPVVEPVKVAPVTAPVITKVVPVKVAPVAEPAKVTPLKVKAAPVVETTKPVTPPVKVKTAPVVVPTKAIAPKVVTPPVNSVVTPPVNSKESTKDTTQVTPKAETAKDVLPEKEPKTFKPTSAPKDVFKNFSNFDPRKFFPAKTEETKPESSSPDTKETSEAKPEAKSTDKPPALTDLSTTTSTPVKVLTKK